MKEPDRASTDRTRMEAAFRELHGRRLHGFALLLTLGDAHRAAALAGEALSAGSRRAAELRHPERAAAWLRARVTHRAGRRVAPADPNAVAGLGVDQATLAGLAALDIRTRAAVVGRVVEGLDLRDVATIVDREGRAVTRLLDRGITRYATARSAVVEAVHGGGAGPIVTRIDEAARRVIS